MFILLYDQNLYYLKHLVNNHQFIAALLSHYYICMHTYVPGYYSILVKWRATSSTLSQVFILDTTCSNPQIATAFKYTLPYLYYWFIVSYLIFIQAQWQLFFYKIYYHNIYYRLFRILIYFFVCLFNRQQDIRANFLSWLGFIVNSISFIVAEEGVQKKEREWELWHKIFFSSSSIHGICMHVNWINCVSRRIFTYSYEYFYWHGSSKYIDELSMVHGFVVPSILYQIYTIYTFNISCWKFVICEYMWVVFGMSIHINCHRL